VNSQGNTQQKERARGITIPNFKLTILQSNSNKNSMVLAQNRHEYQWNRIEDPDMNPHSYTHLIFDKGTKNIQWKIASSTNDARTSGYLPAKN
jgi:hypothetical protein